MTESEAIEYIKNMAFMCKKYEKCQYGHQCTTKCLKATEMAIQALKEIREYRELGTVEELKELKEKSVAKKVIRQGYAFLCPACYRSTLDGIGLESDWCPKCGQKLDWWMKGGATDEG